MSSEFYQQILDELKKISRLLLLIHGDAIERELSKIATTKERKKMWVLIDGTRMSKEIAEIVGVTPAAVNVFLRQLSEVGLAENPRGKPPRRIIDYVPPSWLELLEEEEGRPRARKGRKKKGEKAALEGEEEQK